MFKKLFGPKKVEGIGTPVPTGVLRGEILKYFPSTAEINQYLKIESLKDSPEGFTAVWKFYARERDDEGYKRNYEVTHRVEVDVRPAEHTVQLKARNMKRTARVPQGAILHSYWSDYVHIGLLEDLQKLEITNVHTYSTKKFLAPLVECITRNGWDVLK